ncbi:MAG: NADH:ubiquinone reductase (Na(+)-transporting) subunit F [Bacteroidetes bacterium]|nr:NADH:ubiquinone reductase (Na(+)-transporting) subunit F [Bacteroidota bacterium]
MIYLEATSTILPTILTAIGVFLLFTMMLVSLILFAKAKLTPSGAITLTINGEKSIEVQGGGTILSTLSSQGIFLPSACGGGGTCIQCKCQVVTGGGEILPTEKPHFSRKEVADHWRLGCQVKIKENMEIQVPEEVLGIKEWEATVVSNYNVASFIKELVVEIPEDMDYQAGGYIQIKIPDGQIKFEDMDITAHPQEHPGDPDKFQYEWDKFKLWPLVMENDDPELVRAYSMASYPAEGRKIILNVRVACPPFDSKTGGWMDVNPGVASSYIFALKPGEKIMISGPYGDFFIKQNDSEMIYIGGGAGMAPLRSHLYQLFKTIYCWVMYGGHKWELGRCTRCGLHKYL